jgi:hypothetical protein
MQHTNPIPIRYVDGDELIHTDAHPLCDDGTCPCYSEAETMKHLTIRLPKTPEPQDHLVLSPSDMDPSFPLHNEPTLEIPSVVEDAASADTEPEQTATPTPPRKHRGVRLHVLRKEEEEET